MSKRESNVLGALLLLIAVALARPVAAWTDPCEPKEAVNLCDGQPFNASVCQALDPGLTGPEAVETLRTAASSARAEFMLSTRLDAGRLISCRLLALQAPAAAAEVLRTSLDSVLATIARTERDEGVLTAVADVAVLQAEAGFDLDFGRTLSEFERLAATYGKPGNVVFARGLLGKGLAAIGRHDLARDQFERSLAVALTLPERDRDRGPRLGGLQTLVQMEAEAGLWDLAAAALPHLVAAAPVIDELPATDGDRQGMWRSIELLRNAVERREWPPRH